MYCMFVTLEVSKLSGWLNTDTLCRESKGGHTVWQEVQSTGRREVAGDRGARSVLGRARDCRLGAGHGEERTENMLRMLVTLEVLKLSGWLNAYACCRESKQGRTVRGELRTWRREMAGDVPSSVQGRGRLQIRGRARGGSARRTCGTWL